MSGFVWPVRVYLEDTDAQGVVYNASYFRFLERARTEWLRARGIDHGELRERHGISLVLTAIDARFRASARLGDELGVSAEVVDASGVRCTFGQTVVRNLQAGPVVCEARAEVACVDADAFRPRRWPDTLLRELVK